MNRGKNVRNYFVFCIGEMSPYRGDKLRDNRIQQFDWLTSRQRSSNDGQDSVIFSSFESLSDQRALRNVIRLNIGINQNNTQRLLAA